MDSLKTVLQNRGLLAGVLLTTEIDTLLSLLEVQNLEDGTPANGEATLGVNTSLGFFALNLNPPGPTIPIRMEEGVAPQPRFRVWLVLSKTAPAKKLFTFVGGAPGVVLRGAEPKNDDDEEWLQEIPGEVSVEGANVSVLIEGVQGKPATMRLTPAEGGPDGIVQLKLVPPAVLLGDSGFGFEIPDGFTLDDSETERAPGQTMIAGRNVLTPADDAAWRGLVVRQAKFYIPRGLAFIGGHAVDAYILVGRDPNPGIDLAIFTKVPATERRPGIEVRIECHDPMATSLTGFVPTLVEAAMELPLDNNQQQVSGNGVRFVAGKPVIVRTRFTRSASDPQTRITLALESQGSQGIVAVQAPDGGPAATAMIGAGALATAMVADKPPPGADTSGVILHALLVLSLGLSSFLKNKGKLVVHNVQLASTGHGLPVGGKVELKLDYSVDVLVKPISVGALSVQIRDEQPMRVRNRNVGVTIDPTESGLEMLKLNFSQADMEIEDPGSWMVEGPASLFDILGTRSGRGSMWLEVDLKFKLNLGPVKVSGATIRMTRNDEGEFLGTLRGLDASIEVPGTLKGRGKFQMLQGGGFSAALDVNVVPLNLAAAAVVLYKPEGDAFLLFLQLGVDLPGAIPIANTGVGLYGLAGSFGINARPVLPANSDPIVSVLKWDSSDPLTAFGFARDNLTIGAEVVIATLADVGFSFSTRGGIFVTVPDVAVRGSLWGKVLQPRLKVTERPSDSESGLAFKGVVLVDVKDGITIGLQGTLSVPVLLKAVVPLGARFPLQDPSDWYVYLGADGYDNKLRKDGRTMGPIRATVLPDLIEAGADAYLMLRGKGIDNWPRGQQGAITIADGFVITTGFSFEFTIGIKPVVWAEVHAGADLLIASCPLTIAGFGHLGGSLNLGPFSIGVDAQLSFMAAENADPYLHARLCGHIDLFFTEIEGCVEISVHNPPALTIPPPDIHPLDRVQDGVIVGDAAYLIDDTYRRIVNLSRTKENVTEKDSVWPDTLIHLAFTVSPHLAPGFPGIQFTGIQSYPSGLAAKSLGSDMLRYDWILNSITLTDVTDSDVGVNVAGPLSAAWQAAKDGNMGIRPQPGELVLLTWKNHLWLDRLADSGSSLPNDPLIEAAGLCELEATALIGWAVGWGAVPTDQGFSLPTDPLNPDPKVSQFTATLKPGVSTKPDVILGPSTVDLVPPPHSFHPAELRAHSPQIKLERDFWGSLELGMIVGGSVRTMEEIFQIAEINPSEPITRGCLWLTIEDESEQSQRIAVRDETETWSRTDARSLGDGRTALRFAPTGTNPASRIFLRWQMDSRLGILGVGGLTKTAEAAAAIANAAIKAESQRNANAASKQPQQAGDTKGAEVRCLLDPGRFYRIDVNIEWTAQLYQQDENGKKKLVAEIKTTDPDQKGRSYRPKGRPEESTNRSYYFRTTPKPQTGPPNLPVKSGQKMQELREDFLQVVHFRQDLFHPEMLTRHLLGYEPGQSEMFRFCDDPLRVHFKAAHAAALAKQYGYTLKLGLRRVDVPGPAGEPVSLPSSWIGLTTPSFLTGADKRRFEVAATSRCSLPRPGATLEALSPLITSAWYEVYTELKSDTPEEVSDARLEGVTFKTSRWRSPSEMITDLAKTSRGDVEIRLLPPFSVRIVSEDDGAFEEALDLIGLDGWPPASDKRMSIIWLRSETDGNLNWKCAGLLIESPEPVHRKNRVKLISLSLIMGDAGTAVTFDIHRRDRINARLLYLTSNPFKPQRWSAGFGGMRFPQLELKFRDLRINKDLSGTFDLSLAPSFASEA